MDESVKSGARLEVSVSFGRFENDALSWEKWSSFSPNKYLEEVGNLSTPGSVAQKKAYFEAHYKRIAARKAEELEQEKSSKEDSLENSHEIDSKFGSSNGAEEDPQEARTPVPANEAVADLGKDDDGRSSEYEEQRACPNSAVEVIASAEEKEDDAVDLSNCGSSIVEEVKDEPNVNNVDDPEFNARKDDDLVGLKTPQKDSQHAVEKPQERKNGIERSSALKKVNSKSSAQNTAQKATPTKNERSLGGMKKKVVLPAAKPLQATPTPRYSKPTSMSTPISAPQTLKKKVNGSPTVKSKNISAVGDSKRGPPTSLHMSMSLGPANSLAAAISINRKSLIMERMGDKDIVRRAFKTFQNRTNGSVTTDEKPSSVQHVSATAVEPKIPTTRTPMKRNEGPRKDAEKRATPRSQSGSRSNPLPSGSHKSSGLDRKNAIALSSMTGLRNDEKAEKRKEFLKKLEAKSIAREAENNRLSAKSKVVVENETHHRLASNQ